MFILLKKIVNDMIIPQLSIFLENKSGRLTEVSDVPGENSNSAKTL